MPLRMQKNQQVTNPLSLFYTQLANLCTNFWFAGNAMIPPQVCKAKRLYKAIERKCGVRTIDDEEEESAKNGEESDDEKEERESEDCDEEGDKDGQGEYGNREGSGEDKEWDNLLDMRSESMESVEVVNVCESTAPVSIQGTRKEKRRAEG